MNRTHVITGQNALRKLMGTSVIVLLDGLVPCVMKVSSNSKYLINLWMLWQKQVLRAGTSNYIPQILWDAINCSLPKVPPPSSWGAGRCASSEHLWDSVKYIAYLNVEVPGGVHLLGLAKYTPGNPFAYPGINITHPFCYLCGKCSFQLI